MRKWQILEFDGKPYYAFVPENDTPLSEEDIPNLNDEDSVRNNLAKVECVYGEETPDYGSIDEKYYDDEEEMKELMQNKYSNGDVEEGEKEEEEEEEEEEIDVKPILLNGFSKQIDDCNAVGDLYQVKVHGSMVTIEKLAENIGDSKPTANNMEAKNYMSLAQFAGYEVPQIVQRSSRSRMSKNRTQALKCKACSETFGSGIAFRKHVAWTHKKKVCIQEDGAYICAVCDYRTLKKSLFAAHLERKHETWSRKRTSNLLFPCAACGFICRSKHSLQSHFIRKHTDKYEHHCKFCPKKFKVKGDLTNHVRFHHKEKPVNCDVCGKLCQNSGSLYVHQKWAHYKPKYECHICKRRMVTQENLDQHMITQHEQREKIVCAECGKTFTKKDSFKRHMSVHTGCKPHSCLICSKPFARRSQLRQHLLIHTGKRPFVCDICGKAFTQKPGLICHRKTHPGPHPPLPVMPIGDIVKEFTDNFLLECSQENLQE